MTSRMRLVLQMVSVVALSMTACPDNTVDDDERPAPRASRVCAVDQDCRTDEVCFVTSSTATFIAPLLGVCALRCERAADCPTDRPCIETGDVGRVCASTTAGAPCDATCDEGLGCGEGNACNRSCSVPIEASDGACAVITDEARCAEARPCEPGTSCFVTRASPLFPDATLT